MCPQAYLAHSQRQNLARNCDEMSVLLGNLEVMENLQGFEGLSVLEESAVRLNEVYKALVSGGFTEEQALNLIVKMNKKGDDNL